jgi:hypothetical protein
VPKSTQREMERAVEAAQAAFPVIKFLFMKKLESDQETNFLPFQKLTQLIRYFLYNLFLETKLTLLILMPQLRVAKSREV